MKQLLACALAALTLSSAVVSPRQAEPVSNKNYSQIIHDARADEFNEYYMIVSPGDTDGGFTATDGHSGDYTDEQLNYEAQNFTLPLLRLEETDYEDFAASVSPINIQCYGIAIIRPAEGRTEAVKTALEDYVNSQKQSMEFYLEDQYKIACAATVTVVPTGEVVLVCCENSDLVYASIAAALAA